MQPSNTKGKRQPSDLATIVAAAREEGKFILYRRAPLGTQKRTRRSKGQI